MSIDTTAQTTLSEHVAEEIRVVMARRRMRQSQLARLLGVNDQWVSVRLRGAQEIGLNDLQQIANALRVKPGELLGSGPTITPRYTKPAGRSTSASPARTDAKPAPTRAGRPPSYPGNARRPQLLNGRSGR